MQWVFFGADCRPFSSLQTSHFCRFTPWEYIPGPQFSHTRSCCGEQGVAKRWPAWHDLHTAQLVAPVLAVNWPSGQLWHEDALVVMEKVPAVQSEHTTLVVGVAATTS